METGKQIEKLYLTDKVLYIGKTFGTTINGTYYNLIGEFDNDYLIFDDYGNELAIPKTQFADKADTDQQIAKAISKEIKQRAKNYMSLKGGYKFKEETQDDVQKDNHYDNSNGSLYLFAEQQGLNSWEFDIIKRVVRCRKKGQFKEDLEKTIRVIELYAKEYNP